MELNVGLAADREKQDRLRTIKEYLAEAAGCEMKSTSDWSELLDWVEKGNINVLIIDEYLGNKRIDRSSLSEIVKKNAMLNIVAVSSLPRKEFHEETEGLGVLMQLPVDPGKKDAEQIVDQLVKISGLLAISEENLT